MGYVNVWGDTVQPGGFMQAAAFSLAVYQSIRCTACAGVTMAMP